MKKILFSLVLLASFSANAQIKVAKNYVLTDINGKTHDLYSYLDQGYTIIMDISAAWCGPCWSFHQTGTLETVWADYGPAGEPGVSASTTNNIIVLFVEGETSNTIDQIYGIQGNTGDAYKDNTQGNWVTGTPYPIVDLPSNSSLMSDMGLTAFPSIYKICPNRVVEEVGRTTPEAYQAMAVACPPAGTEQIDAAYLDFTSKTRICGPANYTPKVLVQNVGKQNLKDITVTITDGTGATVSTGSYNNATGISPYSTTTVICSAISGYSGGTLNVDVTTTGDTKLDNGKYQLTIIPAVEVTNQITISGTTDGYGEETSWRIKTGTGSTVSGTTMATNTLPDNTDFSYTYFLSTTGCFSVVLNDTYGDGTSAIQVTDNFGTVIYDDPTLGALKTIEIPFKVTNNLAVDELKGERVTVYPNPTNGVLNLKGESLNAYKNVVILDAAGRELGNWDINNTFMQLDLSYIAAGNYLLVFKGAEGNRLQQIQIAR